MQEPARCRNLKNLVPAYRHHKATGQAVVTLGGRDIYLGKYNTAASRREYSRLIAEWIAHDGTLPHQSNDLTVTELAAAFMRHAKGCYRGSHEAADFKPMIRRL